MAEPTNDDLFSWLSSDHGKAALAGAAGGIVRWVTLRERWQDGLLSLLVGALCALYLGPFVNPFLKPAIGDLAPNGDSAGFASFIVGLGGISLSGLLIDMIRARRVAVNGEGKVVAKGDGDTQD